MDGRIWCVIRAHLRLWITCLNPFRYMCSTMHDFSEWVTAEDVKKPINRGKLWQLVNVCLWELVENQFDVCSNRLHLLWDQTHLDYSPQAKLSTNKRNGTLHHPFLREVVAETRKKKSSSYSTNTSLFGVQTRKNEGLFFSGLALHMTSIWGYCVFWPERVVYDRWQERKSRAAGSSTDAQIAFSWLPHSAWYLSSGLQYAPLFTARKQLINSTDGGGGRKTLMFFLCWLKEQIPQVASEQREIKCIPYCVLFLPHQKNETSRNTDVFQDYRKPTLILVCD